MSDLAILVLPQGPLQAIRATLHDWVVFGKARRHVVVSREAINGSATPAVLVTQDGLSGATLQLLIAQLNPTELIRFVVIEDAGAPSDDSKEQQLAELIEGAAQARVQRLRVFVKRSGISAAPRGREGWDNVLISAEDSTAPGAALGPLPPEASGSSLSTHESYFVAALAGLFTEQKSAPFDDRAQLPDGQIMAGRVFIRRLDTSEVENSLRGSVLDMSKGLPRPVEQGVEMQWVEDVALANRDMADHLWKKHGSLFAGHRRVVQQTEVKEIGAWEALKHFSSFLLSLTRTAPRAWVASLIHQGKVGVASKVRGFVYGPSANIVVSFGGARVGDGAPAAAEFLAALRDADGELAELSGGQREHIAHVDTSRLWRDYIGGGLTLADGRTRVEEMPAVRVGSRTAIARYGAQIAPSSGEAFEIRDGSVAAQLPTGHVGPSDLLEAENLRGHLKEMSKESMYGVQASQELDRLGTWIDRQRVTYSGQVLSRVAAEILKRTQEVRNLQDLIKRVLDDNAELDRLTQQATRARRKVWIIAFIALLTIAGAIGGWLIGAISGLVAGIIAAVVFCSGIFGSFIAYYKGQVDLWRRAAQLREDMNLIGPAQENIVSAVRDMRRLGDAYQLGLLWTRVLGTFMADPLPNSSDASEVTLPIRSPRPLNSAVGAAQADPTKSEQAAMELKKRVFTSGWMGYAWSQFLGSAAGQLGKDGAALVNKPEALYEQRAAAEDDLLEKWADTLDSQGSASTGADEIWLRCLRHLVSDRQVLLAPLLGAIETSQGGREMSVSEAEFMAPIAQQHIGATLAPFSFTDHGLQDGINRVGWPWVSDESEEAHLGRLGILMQFTSGGQPYHFGEQEEEDLGWEGLAGV